jgi:hypothetical protein
MHWPLLQLRELRTGDGSVSAPSKPVNGYVVSVTIGPMPEFERFTYGAEDIAMFRVKGTSVRRYGSAG